MPTFVELRHGEFRRSNHGRALARVARLLGLGAKIFVPEGMAAARREAIAGEGAEVIVVEGTYDEVVERSAAEEGESGLVVSNTSWSGYERIPSWVIEGYSPCLLWLLRGESSGDQHEQQEEARRALGVNRESRVLLFNCEGATDPDAYRRLVGGTHASS